MWQVLREILNQVQDDGGVVQDDGGVVQDDEERNHLCLIVYCSHNNYLKTQASSVVELACVCYSTLTIIDFKSFLLELVPYNSSYLPGIVRMVLVLSSKNSNDSLSSVIPAFAVAPALTLTR